MENEGNEGNEVDEEIEVDEVDEEIEGNATSVKVGTSKSRYK